MTFSILTPSFNQLDWLRLCVASVRDQVEVVSSVQSRETAATDPRPSSLDPLPLSVEHIIQDAGSPGIEEFAREVGADFYKEGNLVFRSQVSDFSIFRYRIAVHCESDSGMYDAINRGLARSSGEVCAWLNSDEQYLPGTLEYVAQYFRDIPATDVLLGDALLTDENHNPVCYRRIMVPNRWHTRLDHLHSLSCAMFFRRSASPTPAFDPRWKIIGDAVLMDYFLGSKKKMKACGKLLSTYAFTGANLSGESTNSEHSIWRNEAGWPPSVLRKSVIIHNRIRRMMHGAYRQFSVRTGVYTKSSPKHRQTFESTVSGIWPKCW